MTSEPNSYLMFREFLRVPPEGIEDHQSFHLRAKRSHWHCFNENHRRRSVDKLDNGNLRNDTGKRQCRERLFCASHVILLFLGSVRLCLGSKDVIDCTVFSVFVHCSFCILCRAFDKRAHIPLWWRVWIATESRRCMFDLRFVTCSWDLED